MGKHLQAEVGQAPVGWSGLGGGGLAGGWSGGILRKCFEEKADLKGWFGNATLYPSLSGPVPFLLSS